VDNIEQESLPEHTASIGAVSGLLLHTHTHRPVGQYVTQLPIPSFVGDTLQFKTFWDFFEVAVHNNEGAQVIANLPLTQRNYLLSIKLLKDRFGQPYKLAIAHMEALMNLPRPGLPSNFLQ